MSVSGTFFYCVKNTTNMKMNIDEYILYIKNKYKPTYLIGEQLINIPKILAPDERNWKNCFTFILWFENGKRIKTIKKFDKDLYVYKVECPLAIISAMEIGSEYNMKNVYYEIGKAPDFVDIYEDRSNTDKIYCTCSNSYPNKINGLYVNELLSECEKKINKYSKYYNLLKYYNY